MKQPVSKNFYRGTKMHHDFSNSDQLIKLMTFYINSDKLSIQYPRTRRQNNTSYRRKYLNIQSRLSVQKPKHSFQSNSVLDLQSEIFSIDSVVNCLMQQQGQRPLENRERPYEICVSKILAQKKCFVDCKNSN